MVTVGSWRAFDIFFNGVERDNKASAFMDEKSAPNWHSFKVVIFDFCTFLKKQ